ncbi:unnamed protein product, partial [Ectocarpus sp. 4 AP-2014]
QGVTAVSTVLVLVRQGLPTCLDVTASPTRESKSANLHLNIVIGCSATGWPVVDYICTAVYVSALLRVGWTSFVAVRCCQPLGLRATVTRPIRHLPLCVISVTKIFRESSTSPTGARANAR